MSWTEADRAGWREYRPLLAVGIVAVAGAGLLELSGSQAFGPYFGPLSPTATTAGVIMAGIGALAYLRTLGWSVAAAWSARRLLLGAGLAAVFAIPVVAIDAVGAFPRDINVPAPQSLVFYPVIALVAECAFHAIPLALLCLVSQPLARRLGRAPVVWSCVALAALIEPTLQAVWTSDGSPAWATAYVSVHVLAINLVLLYFFRRFGFMAAYGFRLLYYLVWHVGWGALRLPVLFGA